MSAQVGVAGDLVFASLGAGESVEDRDEEPLEGGMGWDSGFLEDDSC